MRSSRYPCRLQWPLRLLRAVRRPGGRCEHMLAVGLDGAQALADEPRRTEQPTNPRERVLDDSLARGFQRLIRLEDPKSSRRSKNPRRALEQRREFLATRHRVIEYHRLENRPGSEQRPAMGKPRRSRRRGAGAVEDDALEPALRGEGSRALGCPP